MAIFDEKAWRKYYGLVVPELPFDHTVLQEPCPFESGKIIAETHYLFRGVSSFVNAPLTIMKWHEIAASTAGHPQMFGDGEYWYKDVPAASAATCEDAWYLIYGGLVQGSDRQIPYLEIIAVLPPLYRVPSGIELVTAHLTAIRDSDTPLLTNKWAWSSDTCALDHQMIVGHYHRDATRGPNCLRINLNWYREERGSTGLQPIRQLT